METFEEFYAKQNNNIDNNGSGNNGNGDNGNGNNGNGNGDRVNFRRLNFNYFITHSDGTIIGCAKDDEDSDFTYAIAQDGTVKYRKNQGVWKQLSILDAASIRYFAGRFYNRSVPNYCTSQAVV